MKLITASGEGLFVETATGHPFKWSTATSMNLLPDKVGRNGLAKSIDIVSESFGIDMRRIVRYLGIACAFGNYHTSLNDSSSSFDTKDIRVYTKKGVHVEIPVTDVVITRLKQ